MAKRKLLLLHGPNLDMLGVREPEIYGRDTLATLEARVRRRARGLGLGVTCRQSNYEGEFIGWIHKARGRYAGIIINAGAWTHTSVAILDALKIAELPVVEVHITNPKEREAFRHVSYIEPVAAKVISGRGIAGYDEAVDWFAAAPPGALPSPRFDIQGPFD